MKPLSALTRHAACKRSHTGVPITVAAVVRPRFPSSGLLRGGAAAPATRHHRPCAIMRPSRQPFVDTMTEATPVIRLRKNEERRLKAGHLWIYANEIDTRQTPE